MKITKAKSCDFQNGAPAHKYTLDFLFVVPPPSFSETRTFSRSRVITFVVLPSKLSQANINGDTGIATEKWTYFKLHGYNILN